MILTGADIFDGQTLLTDHALHIRNDRVHAVIPRAALGADTVTTEVGGTILPGFVDLQVNGGGGVLLNDAPSVETLQKMADAHRGLGTRAFLPTLITDTPAQTQAAISAVKDAINDAVPGIVGLHLEGPHLSVARKGAHAADLIRPMDDEDERLLCKAADQIPNLLVTLAPEAVTPAQIARLSDAGVIVSLGHSDCSYDDAITAFDAGARGVTHLFNAMSQISARDPGLVGAALDRDDVFVGLIADGIHVHGANMRTAMARAGNRLVLVSDAMATAGSEIDAFSLTGRRVLRRDGRLTLEDGTLAGADLEFARAIQVMTETAGAARTDALAMATSRPASALREPKECGALIGRAISDVIRLDAQGHLDPLPAA